MHRRLNWRTGGILLMAAVFLAIFQAPALAQNCTQNQVQLSQALTDSESALVQVRQSLDAFGRDLIGPRDGPLDASQVSAVTTQMDAYVNALTSFEGQVRQYVPACGPGFAADADRLSGLIGDFRAQRERADRLLADHTALVQSGEPAMSQGEMEAVQLALAALGHYNGGADGRFGPGTRGAISAFQAAQGQPQTGYLTPDQRQALLTQAAQTNQPPNPNTSDPNTPVPGTLPPAPPVADNPPPALDPQTAQICQQNTAEVENAVTQASTFRQQITARVSAFRTATRGPRVPEIDEDEGTRIISEIDSYVPALENFQQQAGAVAGQCGAAFDDALSRLGSQIDGLRSQRQRAGVVVDALNTLLASGEPPMDEETMQDVQTGLKALGHYGGPIDALFGSGTRRAISAYQTQIGQPATGYLTAAQIIALRDAAAPAPTPTPTPNPPTPTPTQDPPPNPLLSGTSGNNAGTSGGQTPVVQVRAELAEALSQKSAPPLMSSGGGSSGLALEDALHWLTANQPQRLIDERASLVGEIYLDNGPDTVAMADAHVLIAEAYAQLGLFGDAVYHAERAGEVWVDAGGSAEADRARMLAQIATMRLARALTRADDATISGAEFDQILAYLNEARNAASQALPSDDPLQAAIVDRLADLHVAAGRSASDSAIRSSISARYG